MSKQSAEALVLLEQLVNNNYKISIESRGNSSRQYFELTLFKSPMNDTSLHFHHQGDTFIDVIMTAAKAEKLI